MVLLVNELPMFKSLKLTPSSIDKNYPLAIKQYKGDNLQEKTTNYLLDKGVKQEELDTLKEMMIPER